MLNNHFGIFPYKFSFLDSLNNVLRAFISILLSLIINFENQSLILERSNAEASKLLSLSPQLVIVDS